MQNRNLPVIIKSALNKSMHNMHNYSKNTWVRVAFAAVGLFILSQKEMSIQLSIGNTPPIQKEQFLSDNAETKHPYAQQASFSPKEEKPLTNVPPKSSSWWEEIRDASKDVRHELNLANAATAIGEGLSEAQQKQAAKYSNLGLVINPGFAREHGISPAIVAHKRSICFGYINQYKKTAQEEAKLFGIPASITLAQGLLESNAGDSRLAKNENNHFGIKCRKKCIGCRCANYTDDSKYDMFRIFDSSWQSFREHSKLLNGKRYRHLLKLRKTDYKNWAHGLQAAGYATDKSYGKKLIKIIEALELYKYDQ